MNQPVPEGMKPLLDERDLLERLLKGAIHSVQQANGTLGPEVQQWWDKQPDALDDRARSAVLSVSDEEFTALNQYVEKYGHLPRRA